MGGRERYHRGGIGRLRELLDEYPGPIEAELLYRGYRLGDIGTPRLDWREFGVFISKLPPVKESALYRARYPRSWHWTPEMELLALILHAVQGANWQRSGGKGEAPELITRPADDIEAPEPANNDGFELHEIREVIARRQAEINALRG